MPSQCAENELPTDVESLRTLVLAHARRLEQQHDEHESEVERLHEIIRLLKRKHFGKSSERVPTEQMGLFNEAEELASKEDEDVEEEPEETIDVPAHQRSRPKRKPLPENIAREERVIEIEAHDRRCPIDGALMREIGEEVSEKLDVIPMQLKVIRTIRKKYACAASAAGNSQGN